MKKLKDQPERFPRASMKGIVLTGIVILFSIFLLAMANLLVRSIQKNYRDLVIENQEEQKEYLAEGGWTYFVQKWKEKKIHLTLPFKLERKNIIEKKRGWFRMEAFLQGQKNLKRIYKFSIWSGLSAKESSGPILWGKFQVKGRDLKITVWNLR